MIHSVVSPFRWNADLKQLDLLDQLALPEKTTFIPMHNVDDIVRAIKEMVVRGAPAIGISAAYGIYYAARDAWNANDRLSIIQAARDKLAATRPTAVNLFWALDRMMSCVKAHLGDSNVDAILKEAKLIWDEDIAMNQAMAEHGADAIGNVSNILTHCNAGALATGGLGTALAVIREIDARQKAAGKHLHVWVDETRPYLQGARLTAWELMQDGIDCTLITDNMAAHMMQKGLVDAIVVGADRIAKNGDFANKIGTYGLAVLAKFHKVPFYTAAPTSTFDPQLESGKDIVIEERSTDEVVYVKGKRIAPEGVKTRHPAFDVTPHELVSGIITPEGVIHPQ